ncbi:MAG: serine hydrolase [Pirellulales bacterium]|nr:serine hydrolase [Pirellulales bacterium]
MKTQVDRLCLFLVAIIVAICRSTIVPLFAQQMVFPGTEWQEATPESVFLDSTTLTAAVDYLRTNTPFGGGVDELVIIRNGRMIWKGSYIDNVHETWSVGKSFTSTVLGLLIDDGRASLDTLAKDYVPDLETYYSTVTLRHFATMTSGYRECGGLNSFPPDDNSLIPDTSWFAPGLYYYYSNSGMEQFSRAMTHIAQEPIEELFRSRIAEPIGMNPIAWDWKDLTFYGGGLVDGFVHNTGMVGMYISAREAARFGHLFLNRGQWDGKQLLSTTWADEATRVQVPVTIPPYLIHDPMGPGTYGYNWWINGTMPDGNQMWPGAPSGTFSAWGYGDNLITIVPEWNMVVTRLGTPDPAGRWITPETWGKFLSKIGLAGSTAIWDEGGDGNWADFNPIDQKSHWLNDTGNSTIIYPDGPLTPVVVRANRVTVTGSHSARSLSIESGAVAIDATGALTVADGVDIAAGTGLDVAGSLSASELTTAGHTMIAPGAHWTVNRMRVNEGGLLLASSDGSSAHLKVTGGMLQLNNNATITVSTASVSGGTVTTGDGQFIVSKSLTINNIAMRVAGAAFQIGSEDMVDPSAPGRIELLGGTLSFASHNPEEKRIMLVSDAAPDGRDAPLVQLMESLGYSVDTSGIAGAYQETQQPFGDPDKVAALHAADLVLVSSNISDQNYDDDRRQWNDLDVPLVAMNGRLTRGGTSSGRWGWTTGTIAADRTEDEMVIAAGSENHPFLYDLISPVQVFDWTSAPDQQAPIVWPLPAAASPSHQLATFGGRPFLLDIPAGYDLDSGGIPVYGVTGARRALVADWNYGSGAYDFDSFITDDYRTLLANVLHELVNFAPGPLDMPNVDLDVMADSVLQMDVLGTARFGSLRMAEGVSLEASGGPIAVSDLIAGNGSTVDSDLHVRGTLCPDDGPGLFTILGDLTMEKDATYEWGLGHSVADLTAVTGQLRLSSEGWTLRLVDEGAASLAEDLVLFTYNSLADGSLGNWTIDTSNVGRWSFVEDGPSLYDDQANHRVLLTGVIAIPEPGGVTLLLTITALALIHCRMKRE